MSKLKVPETETNDLFASGKRSVVASEDLLERSQTRSTVRIC